MCNGATDEGCKTVIKSILNISGEDMMSTMIKIVLNVMMSVMLKIFLKVMMKV